MVHLSAREIVKDDQPTGKFHYTCRDTPVGYCGPDCDHGSIEEACEHYKQYLLDNMLVVDDKPNAHAQYKCKICDVFTSGYVHVGNYRMFILCADHRTRENVSDLLKVGESWES